MYVCIRAVCKGNIMINRVHCVCAGIAIGGGWQALVAYINLASYYIFGLPLGYVLGYAANLGVVVNNFDLAYSKFLKDRYE